MKKKVVTVVGARPQFIKAAAVSRALREDARIEEVLVHTGQHYDPSMSDIFFQELQMAAPNHTLNVGSGTHGKQTAQILERLEQVLLAERPDAVMVYGDTNSTVAGALAASKIQLPVAHVEAGLRSYNRAMPEELNRVVTDHLSTVLFCPTKTAVANLASEGITANVHHVGDVMYDVAVDVAQRAESVSTLGRNHSLEHKTFLLATVHRAENTDDAARLGSIVEALRRLAKTYPVVFPVHPRTAARLQTFGLDLGNVLHIPPVGLLDMTWLERHALAIITDSGGVQKEAYFQRTPCVTARTESEWVETIHAGWNRLANPMDADAIVAAVTAATGARPGNPIDEFGRGDAAVRLVQLLSELLSA